MRTLGLFLASIFALTCAAGQVATRDAITLDDLVKGLANPDFAEVPELTEVIQRRGIDFDLGKQLGAILSAAARGKRDPEQIATLITACLNACQDCRARFLAPMTTDELRALLKSGFTPEAILREVQARGVNDLENSDAAANMWRAAGANDELVKLLVPDDKIPAVPIVGYTPLVLKHAEEYDPNAPKGWLKVTAGVPATSQSVFIFQHNALFVDAKGEGATDVVAYFNKPAPRNTPAERIDFNFGLEGGRPVADEKRGGLLGPRKGKPVVAPVVIEASYLVAQDGGRNAFRIALTNKEMSPQQYSFYLRWQVLTTPKVAAPAPKR